MKSRAVIFKQLIFRATEEIRKALISGRLPREGFSDPSDIDIELGRVAYKVVDDAFETDYDIAKFIVNYPKSHRHIPELIHSLKLSYSKRFRRSLKLNSVDDILLAIKNDPDYDYHEPHFIDDVTNLVWDQLDLSEALTYFRG